MRTRVLLACLIVLAAYLRLANVAENPRWFADEATHIDAASHLAAGRVQYMAVKDSTLLFAKLPLFDVMLAGVIRSAPGADRMLLARAATGVLGTCAVVLLFFGVRQMSDDRQALLAAAALAVFPQAVLYGRFAFSYNLLGVLVLGAFYGLARFAETRSATPLAAASLCIGLGTITDVAGFTFVLPFVLLVWLIAGARAMAWALLWLCLPFVVYAAWSVLHAPRAFGFDLGFTVSRLGGGTTLSSQILTLMRNGRALISESLWIAAGLVGVVVARPPLLVLAGAVMMWLPVFSMGRVVPLNNLSAYYLIPVLPFIALGVAAIIDRLWRWWEKTPRLRVSWAAGGAAVVFALLLLRSSATLPISVHDGFHTPIDRFLIEPGDARNVANYINSHTAADDAVVASPAIAWLLESHVVDFQLLAAAQGRATAHLPGNIPKDRFAFPVTLDAMAFVVVDDLWESWGVHFVPGLREMLQRIQTWPLVLTAGRLRVYRNPNVSSKLVNPQLWPRMTGVGTEADELAALLEQRHVRLVLSRKLMGPAEGVAVALR
jgi:hypothetical protein